MPFSLMFVKDGCTPGVNDTSSGVNLSLWSRRPLPIALSNKPWRLGGALMFTVFKGLAEQSFFCLISVPTVDQMAALAGNRERRSSKNLQAVAPHVSQVKVLQNSTWSSIWDLESRV